MDLNFVELFNRVVDVAKPAFAEDSHASSLDDNLADLGIDSLDTIMMSIYVGDIFGIEEEVMKTMRVSTLRELLEFIEQHKTKTPASIEEAVEALK